MQSGKPRPVPSKAALKVLYQLAYISSGTAFGVAGLCAEERRRRTCTVQRIADNAKRIRQSPRYYNCAAAAVQEADGYDGGEELLMGVQRRWQGKDGLKQPERNDTAIKGPELPSVVEHGYGKVRRAKLPRRPAPSESPPPVRASTAFTGLSDNKHSQTLAKASVSRPGATSKSPPASAARSDETHKRHAVQSLEGAKSSVVYQTLRREPHRRRLVRGDGLEVSTGERRIAEQPMTLTAMVPANIKDATFRTRAAWPATYAPAAQNSTLGTTTLNAETIEKDIMHDIALFFDCARSTSVDEQALPYLSYIANRLLTITIEYGQFDDVRSLLMWKLSVKSFTELDAQTICDAAPRLSSRVDHEELFDFYSNLFRESRFQRIDNERKLRMQDSVLIEAMCRSVFPTLKEAIDALIGPSSGNADVNHLAMLLSMKCRAMLVDGHVQKAADLFLAMHSSTRSLRGSTHTSCTDTLGLIIEATVRIGSLSQGAKLLRLAYNNLTFTNWAPNCDAFLGACDTLNAHGLVVELFAENTGLKCRSLSAKREKREWWTKSAGLSDKSKEVIAFACTKAVNPSRYVLNCLTNTLRVLPESMRERVASSRSSLFLKAAWNSTHDLDAVQARAARMRESLTKSGSKSALRILNLTEVEICISANSLHQALRVISRIHATDPADSQTISLAALLLAKKNAWDSMDRLLTIARESNLFKFDAETTARFNNVIRLYARQHSAIETWKFVTAAVHDLNFMPSYATSEIMLETFVTSRSVDLIPKWLRYVHTIGQKFDLSARVAAKLLTRFYHEHRPSHVLVMWFCRNLASYAPSLSGPDFIDLVKEAIGYDLRKGVGNDSAWRFSSTQQRLASVESAGNVMPSPGHRWNGELYLEPPQSVAGRRGTAVAECRRDVLTNNIGAATATDVPSSSMMPLSPPEFHGNETRYSTVADVPLVKPMSETTEQGPTATSSTETPPKSAEGTPSDRLSQMTEIHLTADDIPSMIQFGDIRSTYDDAAVSPSAKSEHQQPDNEDSLGLRDAHLTSRALERDMILATSLAQYAKVLKLYHGSLDAIGLPASPLVLEVAVEASLRLHRGERDEAEAIMRQAREAGMNVTCAMGPMLIHQMYHLNAAEKKEVNNLRVSVIEYYRMNDSNGWPVKHHVGVTAANILIDNRRPQHGINILDTIYQSEWAEQRKLDIVAMTVFVKGYAAIRSMDGLRWAVETVLAQNMRIDQEFLTALRTAMKVYAGTLRTSVARRSWSSQGNASMVPIIVGWVQQCFERRGNQMLESKLLGKKLVACLARCANQQQQPAIDASVRGDLEDAIFGERSFGRQMMPSSSSLLNAPIIAASKPRKRYLERLKSHVARSVRAEDTLHKRRPRGRMPGVYDRRWIIQYRKFLRTDLSTSDGTRASFGFRLAKAKPSEGDAKQVQVRRVVTVKGTADLTDGGHTVAAL